MASAASCLTAQTPPSSSSHSSSKTRKPDSALDAGSLSAGVYRNAALGFSCKVPLGWVFRTEEMNQGDADAHSDTVSKDGGRVLLAAFSRPPQARGDDVNASIVIAAESAATYPGLTDAAQYVVGPLTDAAKAQGFDAVHDPYEFAVGKKNLPRADFQKNIASRVMRQGTLVMLAKGYVVSFTFIAGTEDDVNQLVEGLSFGAAGK